MAPLGGRRSRKTQKDASHLQDPKSRARIKWERHIRRSSRPSHTLTARIIADQSLRQSRHMAIRPYLQGLQGSRQNHRGPMFQGNQTICQLLSWWICTPLCRRNLNTTKRMVRDLMIITTGIVETLTWTGVAHKTCCRHQATTATALQDRFRPRSTITYLPLPDTPSISPSTRVSLQQ